VYLVPLKTAVVKALRATFVPTYPNELFTHVNVSVEYPKEQTDYPGLWVNYEDNDELSIAGINHKEWAEVSPGVFVEVRRWTFGGTITVTVAALSSLERDGLYDEMVRVFAFGQENVHLRYFRDMVETNPYIGMNINFDKLQPSGDQASQGTPWQTEEWIYEKSLSFDVIGEFVGDPSTGELVALSAITLEITPLSTPTSPGPDDITGTGGWQ
jgi:hypothetical protein